MIINAPQLSVQSVLSVQVLWRIMGFTTQVLLSSVRTAVNVASTGMYISLMPARMAMAVTKGSLRLALLGPRTALAVSKYILKAAVSTSMDLAKSAAPLLAHSIVPLTRWALLTALDILEFVEIKLSVYAKAAMFYCAYVAFSPKLKYIIYAVACWMLVAAAVLALIQKFLVVVALCTGLVHALRGGPHSTP